MNPVRKILSDPVIYILLLFNVFCIYEYKDDPAKYTTIIWIFWCQSVLIGIFNFFELLTTKNIKAGEFKMDGKTVDPQKSTGCYSFFFLFHYEFFHLAYFIFLLIQLRVKYIDGQFLKYSLLAILFNQAAVFIRHKREYKLHPPGLGTLFLMPYLRIIPMHLMIILPAFMHWKPSLVFLILKAFFDIVGHLLTTRSYWQTVPATAQLSN